MKRRPVLMRALFVTLTIVVLSAAATACKPKPTTSSGDAGNGSGTPRATPSAESTPIPAEDGSTTDAATPPKPLFVRVYFTRGDKLAVSTRRIAATKAVASAAMQQLLAGPSADEKSYGLGTTIPAGTRLLGVTVNGGIATVDVSGGFQSGGGTLSMTMRLAQVVHTLTQFSTIKSVRFSLDGKPVTLFGGEGIMIDKPQTRLSYEDVLPAILVESPTPGQNANGAVRAMGTANVFEAVFIAEVRDASGKTLAKKQVTATSGTGTRGTFDVTIPFTVTKTQMGSLVVYEPSAKDGSPINVVTIALKLEK
ncbi:MAG: GerMN domain-containing protein [Actinomycetia bacterium]|nr:GerMN domain-containing protein [Actinomycetes bacterium]